MVEAQGGYFKIYSNVFVCPSNAGGINNGYTWAPEKRSPTNILFTTMIGRVAAPLTTS